MYTTLTPRLVVDDVDAALRFYQAVFDAVPGMRITDDAGNVLHAELDLAGLRMSLAQADGDLNRSPTQCGGSPVLLTLMGDPDDIQRRALAHGGSMVVEVADRYYGMRDGRMRDPSGHHWLVTKTLQHLSEEELNRRSQ